MLPVLALLLATVQFAAALQERSRIEGAVREVKELERDIIRIPHIENAGRFVQNINHAAIDAILEKMTVIAAPNVRDREELESSIQKLLDQSAPR